MQPIIRAMFFIKLNGNQSIMGAIKENNYSDNDMKIAQIGKAMGHPARKQMISLLMEYGHSRNIDFWGNLNLSPSTIKEHIQFLKDADLVTIRYRMHHYDIYLKPQGFDEMIAFLDMLK